MIAVAAVFALAAAEPPATDPAATLAAVQGMYDQSCQVRAYGSYDDLCNSLRKQLKDAEKAHRKAQAEAKRRAAAPETTLTTTSPATPQPAPSTQAFAGGGR